MRVVFKDRGELKGLPRHRTTKSGHIYNPPWVKERKRLIAMLYLSEARGHSFGDKPVRILMDIRKKMPANSWSKKRKYENEGKPSTVKPDVDNIEKLYLDALNGVAYDDDNQVTALIVQKRYDWTDSVTVIIEEDGGFNLVQFIKEHLLGR